MSTIRTRVSDIRRRLHQLRPTLTRRKNAATKKSLPAAGIFPGPRRNSTASARSLRRISVMKRLSLRLGISYRPTRLRPPTTAPERGYETADERRYHDKAYAADDKACAADEDYAEAQSTRRRSSLVLVMAIFGLAVVGTAGAFGYRARHPGLVPPTLPPISKANKIAPAVSAVLEAKNATNTN